jgi:hypothetical protein
VVFGFDLSLLCDDAVAPVEAENHRLRGQFPILALDLVSASLVSQQMPVLLWPSAPCTQQEAP